MFTVQIHTLDATVMRAFAKLFHELSSVISADDMPDSGADIAAHVHTDAAVIGQIATAAPTNPFAANPLPSVQAAPVPNAPLVHSIAAVNPFATVPAATPVISAPAPSAPLPPAVSAAPLVATVAPATAHPALLDSTGLPWDARIHASTRTQTQKGVWKAKKGVDDATVAQVTAELRQAMGAPAPAPFVPLNAQPVAVAPPPPALGELPVTDFASLAVYVGRRGIKAEDVIKVCEAHGLPGLGLVAVRPDLVQPIYAALAAL